jgi:ferrous iron transport protein A
MKRIRRSTFAKCPAKTGSLPTKRYRMLITDVESSSSEKDFEAKIEHRRATLDAVPSGSKGVVVGVSNENKTLCNKLLSMGIVSGTQIEVLSIAPLGDPMKIQALGYKLSLRRSEARSVEVTLA